MTTPKLQMPELVAGQAGKELTHNQALAVLDQLAQAVVVDKDLTAPPGSPANGSMYIVAAGATGAWSGKAGQLAYWLTSTNAWQFIVPREGFLVHVNGEDDYYKYDGAAWAAFSPGGGLTNPMTTLGDIIRGGASGAPERLAVGADGQVLTVVSGDPEWATPAGGGFTGGTLTTALNEALAVTIAAAATVNIGAAAANTISITGTTTITAFDTIADGAVRLLEFAGALTLTHNATSMILPTGANIVTAAGDVAEFRSLGAGNWRCIGYLRAAGTPLAGSGGGGGLTDLAEAKNTAAPNATVPAVSLSVTITETNGDAVFAAKGTGATCAQTPNNLASGGNKRGTYATDWQKIRTAAAMVASGVYSTISGGRDGTAGGQYSTVSGGEGNASAGNHSVVAGGQQSQASGQYSSVLGGFANGSAGVGSSVGGGVSNTADGQYSFIPGGYQATTRGAYGSEAAASGQFSGAGDAQRRRFILRKITTNATTTTLTTDNASPTSANQVILNNNSCFEFRGRVVARENATGDCAAWKFDGVIRRGANAISVALVAAVTPTVIAADVGAAAWTVSVDVDGVNGGLKISVGGEVSHTIRWVADIETVEVSG